MNFVLIHSSPPLIDEQVIDVSIFFDDILIYTIESCFS